MSSLLSAVAKSKPLLPCIDGLRSIQIAKMSVRQASLASQCSSRNSCAHSSFLSCKNIASSFLSSYTRLCSLTATDRWNETKLACDLLAYGFVVVVGYPTPSEGWGHGRRPWSPRSWANFQGLDQRSYRDRESPKSEQHKESVPGQCTMK